MASSSSSLHTTLPVPLPLPITTTTTSRRLLSIKCGGPRSNRGPLVKGRILSIEAIHAIQALKRHSKSLHLHAPKILPRLIKADLLSTFNELLRQNHPLIALLVFSAIRSEYTPSLTLYADLVNALSAQCLTVEIDNLVLDLEDSGRVDCADKGLIKLVRGLVEAKRRESTVRVYRLLKKCGWGEGFEVDENVAEVLSRGLRTMGEGVLADEIDHELDRLRRSNFAKPVV